MHVSAVYIIGNVFASEARSRFSCSGMKKKKKGITYLISWRASHTNPEKYIRVSRDPILQSEQVRACLKHTIQFSLYLFPPLFLCVNLLISLSSCLFWVCIVTIILRILNFDSSFQVAIFRISNLNSSVGEIFIHYVMKYLFDSYEISVINRAVIITNVIACPIFLVMCCIEQRLVNPPKMDSPLASASHDNRVTTAPHYLLHTITQSREQ